ncbi:TetR/AcrR family transcriptional regulator [Roseovarius faecimaris]|nr:TetR/AcrR family transcriptional regulator [Roseovarius faecimaris]
MTLLATPKPANRLTAADWVEAALQALKSGGIEAVQITTLAKALGVTRGSFYWHFESREALTEALLAEWRARNTGVMVEAIRDVATLDDGILALFSVWVDHTRFDPALDQAIRDWARRDTTLNNTVRAEDDARIASIARFFERQGYTQPEAFIRARVIYLTQLSYYALKVDEHESLSERKTYLDAYFKCFTGRDINPATGAAFLAMIEKDAP